MRAPALRLLLLIPLAGCMGDLPPPAATPAAPVPVPPAPVAECRPDVAQRFVGQRLQPSTPEAARLASGSRSVRVVGPGQAVTMDFRADRLTLDLDARGVVTRARCG